MMLALFGFAMATAFVPWWAGAATSPRWLVASIASCAILVVKPGRFTLAHAWGLALVGWAVMSFWWSDARLDSYAALARLGLGTALFLLGSGLDDLSAFYKGAAVGLGLSAQLGLAALAGYLPLPPSAPLFVNPIVFAEAVALIAAALLAVPGGIGWLWWLIPALPLIHGRGAALAFGGALAAYFGRRGMLVAATLGFLAGGLLIGALWLGWLPTVEARFWLWRDTLAGVTWLGYGIGSFQALFAAYATHSNVAEHHAHSMLLETAFELGPLGLTFLTAFLATLLLDTPRSPEKLLLIVFAMDGLYAFPDQLPFSFCVAALAAGQLSRDVPVVGWRDVLGGASERASL